MWTSTKKDASGDVLLFAKIKRSTNKFEKTFFQVSLLYIHLFHESKYIIISKQFRSVTQEVVNMTISTSRKI